MGKKMTVDLLEKKFNRLKDQLKAEARKSNTDAAYNYVDNVIKMMDQTLNTFKQMSNGSQMKVSEKEFNDMLARISQQGKRKTAVVDPNSPPTVNREMRRQNKQPKVNIR